VRDDLDDADSGGDARENLQRADLTEGEKGQGIRTATPGRLVQTRIAKATAPSATRSAPGWR